MVQHRGEIIEKAIRQNGYSITMLANRLRKSRRWMYLMFENSNVPLDIVLEIGTIINYDFTSEIKELKKYQQNKFSTLNSNESKHTSHTGIDYWKDKYVNLLEKYNALLLKSSAELGKKTTRKK